MPVSIWLGRHRRIRTALFGLYLRMGQERLTFSRGNRYKGTVLGISMRSSKGKKDSFPACHITPYSFNIADNRQLLRHESTAKHTQLNNLSGNCYQINYLYLFCRNPNNIFHYVHFRCESSEKSSHIFQETLVVSY